MMRRPKRGAHPRLAAGQCPCCGGWFDGYQVGTGEPTANTAPVVEWSVDARDTGRCVRQECYLDNRFERPVIEAPPPARQRKAG